jgi:hypothetical protein
MAAAFRLAMASGANTIEDRNACAAVGRTAQIRRPVVRSTEPQVFSNNLTMPFRLPPPQFMHDQYYPSLLVKSIATKRI